MRRARAEPTRGAKVTRTRRIRRVRRATDEHEDDEHVVEAGGGDQTADKDAEK